MSDKYSSYYHPVVQLHSDYCLTFLSSVKLLCMYVHMYVCLMHSSVNYIGSMVEYPDLYGIVPGRSDVSDSTGSLGWYHDPECDQCVLSDVTDDVTT